MTRRRLPIGIQTFRTLRERDCYYVDKTAHGRALMNEGSTTTMPDTQWMEAIERWRSLSPKNVGADTWRRSPATSPTQWRWRANQ